jgi:uncharacterized phage protein (TIGR02218 family)
MKTATAAMQAHLAGYETTLAYIWKLKRVDGTILGFTSHDLPITYDCGDGDGPVTYQANTGMTNTANKSGSDLSVDNLEATTFLESGSITEADILAGKYDECIVTLRIVNWSDLTMGDVLLRTGTVGVLKMKNGLFTGELRGLAYKLTAVIGSTYGPICRATFGSGLNGIDMTSHYLCMFDVTTVRQTGSVASSPNVLSVVPNSGLTGQGGSTGAASAGWFNDGFLTFTSGELDGDSFEIKTWDGTTLGLFLPMPETPAAGDTFTIEPGCAKTTSDCQGKFSNIVNFQGEPFIPGMDQLLDYASE